jgi:hypothetical protein
MLCVFAHLHDCKSAILCIYYNPGSPVSTVRRSKVRTPRGLRGELAVGVNGIKEAQFRTVNSARTND